MTKKTNFAFMAFGKANESVENAGFKRYIGAAPVFVKAVNPNKAERDALLGANIENMPEYIGEKETNGKKVPQVRVTFYVQPDVEGAPVIPMTFFVSKEHRYNKDNTKIQVIDKYGYSGWATKEQLASHEQLKSSSGNNLRITTEYRPAYNGEIQLVEFIKHYLNINELLSYIDEKWVINTKLNKDDCECSLDMEKLFKGDFSEIKEIPTLMPTNKVKVMFGVRTTDDNKQYQAVYTNMVLRNNARDYSAIDKDLQERKNAGAFANIEFDTKPFREYKVEETTFTSTPEDMPATQVPWDFGK